MQNSGKFSNFFCTIKFKTCYWFYFINNLKYLDTVPKNDLLLPLSIPLFVQFFLIYFSINQYLQGKRNRNKLLKIPTSKQLEFWALLSCSFRTCCLVVFIEYHRKKKKKDVEVIHIPQCDFGCHLKIFQVISRALKVKIKVCMYSFIRRNYMLILLLFIIRWRPLTLIALLQIIIKQCQQSYTSVMTVWTIFDG